MKIINLLLLLIIFSCNSNTKRDDITESFETKITHDVSSELVLKAKPEQETKEDEDFNTFFEKFKIDSIFQLSRIKDSVKYYTYEEDTDMDLTIKNFPKSTFIYYNYNQDTAAYRSLEHDRYTVSIKKSGDSVIYNMKGVDNGINVFTVFKKNKKGKWFYCSLHDYSI